MIGKYVHWRWLLYILFFGFWSIWLVQQRVENYSRYIVDDCISDIRGSRPAALVLIPMIAFIEPKKSLAPITF